MLSVFLDAVKLSGKDVSTTKGKKTCDNVVSTNFEADETDSKYSIVRINWDRQKISYFIVL